MPRSCTSSQGYKTILLRAVEEASFNRALAAAVGLGRSFGAHIIGLATLPRPILLPAGMPGVSDVVRLDASRRTLEVEIARMAPQFRRCCEAEGLSGEWLMADETDRDKWVAVARVSRAVDLIVGPTPTHIQLSREYDVEDLLLSSGRPMLLLPRGADLHRRPERILVAWDSSCEAARAVSDAMPLLQSARAVAITNVIERQMHSNAAVTALARNLQRHGVPVLINEIDVAPLEVGTALLAAAKANGSELMVMGGYGRSRFSEQVLGGTTRHVLSHTHLPVLVSH